MLKLITFYPLLMLLMVNLSYAEIYRCRDPHGTIIFTDNTSNVSQDCQGSVVQNLPSEVVDPPPQSPIVQFEAAQEEPAPNVTEESEKVAESPYDALEEDARLLAERFVVSRKRVYRSTLQKDKLQGRQELTEIRTEKERLLSELNRSSLSRIQKDEVRGLLASITE